MKGSKAKHGPCQVGVGAEDMLYEEDVDNSSKAKSVTSHLGESEPCSKQITDAENSSSEDKPRTEVENESWVEFFS